MVEESELMSNGSPKGEMFAQSNIHIEDNEEEEEGEQIGFRDLAASQ